MITLYHALLTAGMVDHWLLIELGLPHELRMLDLGALEHKSPQYLALNPAGVVPTMVIDDGAPISEAAAIALHLAELSPAHRLVPPPGTPARAQCYRWMFFLANTLQPAYRAWFYPAEPAGEDHVEASKTAARGRIEGAWRQIAAHLDQSGQPFMLGAHPSVVDFLTTMLMRWSRNMPTPSDRWPVLHAYAQRMKARPSWHEVCRREGLTDWV